MDRCLCLIGTGIAHVVMLEAGLNDLDTRLLTDLFRRDDAGIGLEDGVLGAERKDLEPAVGHKRHAQIVEGHDLLDLIGIQLGEVHRDVGASGMSYYGQMVIIRVRLDSLHFLDRKLYVCNAAQVL